MESGAEVTAVEIARLAGVGRAAVSNWRRRYADFPRPTGGTATSPAFRLADVEAWLIAHDRLPEPTGVDRLWRALRHGSADPDGELPALARVLLASWRTPADARRHAAALAVADEMGVGTALAAVADRYAEVRARRGAAATSAQVAALMCELADVAGQTVLDPACRSGVLPAAAVAHGAAVVAGQDPDADHVTIAQARLYGAAVPAEVRAGGLGADAYPELRADVVLCDPPGGGRWGHDELGEDPRWAYGVPPRGEGELAWVQHALARLRPGGTAVLLLPPGVAQRPAGRRIRRELLRQGALRALITLPAGVTPPHNTRLQLWLLRRPDAAHRAREVLLVEAAGLWDETRATVLAAVRAYEAGRALPEELAGRAVVREAVELSDEDVDLTPARHIPAEQALVTADLIVRRRGELVDLLGRLPATVPPVTPGDGEPPAAQITVGDLVKKGLVALNTDPATVVRPGDVLVPSIGPRLRVRVAGPADDGRPLGAQMFLLRTKPGYVDPWCFAGFLGAQANLRRIVSAGSVPRVDVRKAHMPRLPLTRQLEYAEHFRRLREFEDALWLAATAGEEVARMVGEGLVAGTLGSG
ncbi:SAM-dependent methyltransferase [Catellatospora sp. IY07-71]|uniref:N-6 DNA methylase n=1 Tax=Catellatospora sp. IY07-71 TaxID=2728827 RepID=UPI001BB41E8F|nr:N-6 DNA methylase [Catellatospora sp. IY07-71]BCJ77339.1 SAM-dependent methyltransferase [Catellatospora sp. IY07-71]